MYIIISVNRCQRDGPTGSKWTQPPACNMSKVCAERGALREYHVLGPAHNPAYLQHRHDYPRGDGTACRPAGEDEVYRKNTQQRLVTELEVSPPGKQQPQRCLTRNVQQGRRYKGGGPFIGTGAIIWLWSNAGVFIIVWLYIGLVKFYYDNYDIHAMLYLLFILDAVFLCRGQDSNTGGTRTQSPGPHFNIR